MKRNRKPDEANLRLIYQGLYEGYGPQYWWPASSNFEVMVGAILTQNTAWLNVEKAIRNLKRAKVLSHRALLTIEEKELAELLKPSGYFNIKARRLKNYCQWYQERGSYRQLNRLNTTELRQQLLGVNGIGPETADDILLYAFKRPVFVIDAYTRRILLGFKLIKGDESYETLRALFENALGLDEVPLFNEFHALIVRHAKEACDKTGNCRHCRIEAALD